MEDLNEDEQTSADSPSPPPPIPSSHLCEFINSWSCSNNLFVNIRTADLVNPCRITVTVNVVDAVTHGGPNRRTKCTGQVGAGNRKFTTCPVCWLCVVSRQTLLVEEDMANGVQRMAEQARRISSKYVSFSLADVKCNNALLMLYSYSV